MDPSKPIEAILKHIVSKLEELCPNKGWPTFGTMSLKLTFHDGKVVKTEGALDSITKERRDEPN